MDSGKVNDYVIIIYGRLEQCCRSRKGWYEIGEYAWIRRQKWK